jgi:exosortase
VASQAVERSPKMEMPARAGFDPLAWPGAMWLFLAGVALVYAPIILAAAQQWITNDSYAHGFFIFPVSIFLLWMRKDQIQAAERRPQAWGLLLILVGLIGAIGSDMLQIKYIGMWSLIPTLAGGILALHGWQLWKTVQFSVWFLLFAAPIPNSFLGPITGQIQWYSTTGAHLLMSSLGYPVMQQGNVLQVPGATLEVANACSGFHKLISLLAFAAIYGHLFLESFGKRALLALLALPIALLVNVLRISGLVAASIYGGLPGLHAFHDPAEYVAIGLSFVLFVLAGKKLGCKTTLF